MGRNDIDEAEQPLSAAEWLSKLQGAELLRAEGSWKEYQGKEDEDDVFYHNETTGEFTWDPPPAFEPPPPDDDGESGRKAQDQNSGK